MMIDCLLTFGFFTCQGRGIINGKAGKAAALPKFSDMLTLSQPGGAYYAHTLGLLAPEHSQSGGPSKSEIGLDRLC